MRYSKILMMIIMVITNTEAFAGNHFSSKERQIEFLTSQRMMEDKFKSLLKNDQITQEEFQKEVSYLRLDAETLWDYGGQNGDLAYLIGSICMEQESSQSYKEGIGWYERACQFGNSNAALHIGDYFVENDNYDEALKYFKMAYEMGRTEIALNIAYIYENQGKQQEAEDWAFLAAANGDIEGFLFLERLYRAQRRRDKLERLYSRYLHKKEFNTFKKLKELYKKEMKHEYKKLTEHKNLYEHLSSKLKKLINSSR